MPVLTCLVSFLVLVPQAQAEARTAKAHAAKEREAKKACLASDPAKGVEILADLYIETKDANHIFNQGRCLEQNSRYEDAVARFREYLRKAEHASRADRADAEKHIAECEALLGKREAAKVVASPARASGPGTTGGGAVADRESRERAAKKACLTGDAAKGAEILADLYIDSGNATYIYNQGRCFEQNGRYEDAVARFREYLRKAADASEADRAEAEKHITDCLALVGKKEPEPAKAVAEARPEAGTVVLASPVAAPTMPAQPAAVAITQPMPVTESPSGAGRGLMIAGIVTASVGVAGLIAGVVLNAEYNSTTSDLQKQYDPGRDSSNQTTKTLAVVAYGAGAACVAGGAVLYYLGWRAGRAVVVPAPVAGGAVALLGGTF